LTKKLSFILLHHIQRERMATMMTDGLSWRATVGFVDRANDMPVQYQSPTTLISHSSFLVEVMVTSMKQYPNICGRETEEY